MRKETEIYNRAQEENWETVVFVPKKIDYLPEVRRLRKNWFYIGHTGLLTLPYSGYIYLTPSSPKLESGMMVVKSFKRGGNANGVNGIVFADGTQAGRTGHQLDNAA